jgi:tryptophan-rich sensory protein
MSMKEKSKKAIFSIFLFLVIASFTLLFIGLGTNKPELKVIGGLTLFSIVILLIIIRYTKISEEPI